MKTEFEPPSHLSKRAQDIWRQIVPANARTVGRLTLLRTALETLDMCDRAQAEVTALPKLTIKTLGSGTEHTHPTIKLLKESRAQFAALWSALGLNHYGEDTLGHNQWMRQLQIVRGGCPTVEERA